MVSFSSEGPASIFLQRFQKRVGRFLEPNFYNCVVKILFFAFKFAIDRRRFHKSLIGTISPRCAHRALEFDPAHFEDSRGDHQD